MKKILKIEDWRKRKPIDAEELLAQILREEILNEVKKMQKNGRKKRN